MSKIAKDRQGDSDSPNTSTQRDATPLLLCVFIALGLAVVLGVLWIIFGAPSSKRAGSSEGKTERKSLSREELTIILADDDAGESEGSSKSKNEEAGKRD